MVYNKSIKIAHLINPFKCSENNSSYLYYAQPITMKSMLIAKEEAEKEGINVELCAVNYPEDDKIVPSYFTKLPFLRKSTITEFPKISNNRKLPIIQEMFDNILKHNDFDFIIFTNLDIGIQKNFYKKICFFINQKNLKSFIINRRDNIPKFFKGKRLTEKDLDLIYQFEGKYHPGNDCFVISRDIIKLVNMKSMYTGFPPWGVTLEKVLRKIYPKLKKFDHEYLTFHLGMDVAWTKTNNLLFQNNIKIARTII